MRQITADLITYYADSPNDLYQLMNGARLTKPRNPKLIGAMPLVLRKMPADPVPAQIGRESEETPATILSGYTWTSERYRMLYEALLDAFDHDSLQQLVRIQFDQNLAAIAGGENFTEITFSLMRFFFKRSRRTD